MLGYTHITWKGLRASDEPIEKDEMKRGKKHAESSASSAQIEVKVDFLVNALYYDYMRMEYQIYFRAFATLQQ